MPDEIDLRDVAADTPADPAAATIEPESSDASEVNLEPDLEQEPTAGEEAGLPEFDLGAPSLSAALEALLLLADEPTPAIQLAEVTGRPEPEVEATLAELAMQYVADGRGIELRRSDSGWRFYTATICRDLITRYVTDGRQSKLSQAALETLAIVAYRQPVSRSQVGAIRGVNPDGVIKTLHARGLIAEASAGPEGGVTTFVTTDYFLDRMGIDSVSELPPIADHLPDLESLDDLID